MSLEWFYTLPYCVEEHRIIWRIDPRLRRHIDRLCQIIQPVNYPVRDRLEAAIAEYLFGQLQQHPEDELIRTHWMAFLLRRCEIVAKKNLHQIGNHQTVVGFPDLFMMASVAAIYPANFFRNFDESRYQLGCWHYPTFISFTDTKLNNTLLPELRSDTGNNMFGHSNLGLAARSSRKRVEEALQHSGYGRSEIAQYLQAWQCFQEYKGCLNRRVNQFNANDFQNIATRYNELNETENSVSGSEIQTWLYNIGEAIRRLLDPPGISFWTRFSSHSDEETNLVENIPFETSYDPEMEGNVNRLRQAIAELLNSFQELKDKQMLFLKYGLELKQGQVACELGGKNQSTISRHLKDLNHRILSKIWDWVRENLKIEPSFTGLAEIQAVLYQHYSEKIDCFVKNSMSSLDEQSWRLLHLVYVVKKPLSDIGNMIQRTEEEVGDRLNAMRQQLYSNTHAQIKAEFNLALQPEGAAINSIPTIVETRLETILQYLH